jgi:hypothetical protein
MTHMKPLLSRFSMRHFFRITLCALVLAFGVRQAAAFVLIGPSATYPGVPAGFGDSWETPDIGYNPYPGYDAQAIGPKNIGEEYRRNTPILYYSFDRSFLQFFGSNGVRAVEEAIAMYNNLTNVSSYSADLNEWPLEAERFNYQAQALHLLDLRSFTLSVLTEQLGLTEPVRYVWTLHDRAPFPGTHPPCPDAMAYTVVQRNLDPVPSSPNQLQYSSYVNGTLYSYLIFEGCVAPNPLGEAVEFPVDPLARVYTAIAEHALDFGAFYQSFTRDDIGGLRWLMTTNRINLESAGTNTIEFVTNNTFTTISSSNLTLFAAQALTNDAATLSALYPGLVITATSNTFGVLPVTNFNAFLTNYPWSPAGVQFFVVTSNITYVPITFFHHTFANLVVLQSVDGHLITVPVPDISVLTQHHLMLFQTASVVVTNPPWAPPTSFIVTSNITTHPFVTNLPSGEFFILPTNLCDFAVADVLLTNVVLQTNFLINFTNTGPVITNVNGGSNFANGQVLSFQQYTLDKFTNHTFLIQPVTCPSNPVALYQGIERVQFVRADFDSLLGSSAPAITNTWMMNEITNGTVHTRTMQRVVTQPDILFAAADLAPGPAVFPVRSFGYARNNPFNMSLVTNGLAGPGTIEGPVVFTYSKVGALFVNYRFDPERFLDQFTAFPDFIWGSFDGTTNLPVVYPNGSDIYNLMNQTLMPISPPFAPAGRVSVPYSVQVTTTGGQPPYTWSLGAGSQPLPPGLSLASDGTISGRPTTAGVYAFTLHLVDGAGHAVDYPYVITITP